MVVDEVCVVRKSDSSQCVNQDVLFLGTGTYMLRMVTFPPKSHDWTHGALSCFYYGGFTEAMSAATTLMIRACDYYNDSIRRPIRFNPCYHVY